MGRIIPKTNPKYDHRLDIDALVPRSQAEVANSLMSGLSQSIEVEQQAPGLLVVSGKSFVGVKNIWIEVQFHPAGQGVRVVTRIAKAHTRAWFYVFYVGIGPRRVRALQTYVQLTNMWRSTLGALGASPTPVTTA